MKFGFVYSTLALAVNALAAQVSDAQDTTSLTASLTSTTSISIASGCSFSKGFTATAQSNLDELASCQAVDGDIIITGELGSASIANVKAIYGDLQIYNATELEFFAADAVTTITGSLKLHGLTQLSTLSFGSLTSVGAINWITLPNLSKTGLTQVTECNSILISDTIISSLDGINPVDVEVFNVNNNKELTSISSSIETVSNALTVAFNGDDTVVEFSDLVWANNLTFYSVSSISMPEIVSVNKSAGFFESSVEELEFPLITSIGGDLTIENNDYLNYIDFSNVTSIGGGLVIVNNTDLLSISLDKVKTVAGAVVLKGDFDNCTMDALKTVRGSFELESTGYADCSPFKKLSKKGGIQGDYTCKAATRKTTSSSKSSSKASKSSKSSSTDSASSSATSTADSASASSTSSSDSSASATSSVASISSASKGDASSLRSSSFFGTMAAILLSLL